jgi:hypothetical protein
MNIRLLSRLRRDASSSLARGATDPEEIRGFLFEIIQSIRLLFRLCRDASSIRGGGLLAELIKP